MRVVIKAGFVYRGVQFGWYEGELYRLPHTTGNHHYGVRKLDPIRFSSITSGYRCMRTRLSINKINAMTKNVKWVVDMRDALLPLPTKK